ncbi:MazG nucleotide pyrophosphohydrolase domain-containing protein [Holdemania sp. 1001095H_141210_F2]|jgi:NTP pyrophosphatase (non-canonical NTP hydrolase)|uniref:MazG nucleotide pyrophosphohydrolase domain-containing protein n=1 Tax=Holdemania sp. 1001095H_141210_F2 TaxID=2787149 RepID=UPI00189D9CDD
MNFDEIIEFYGKENQSRIAMEECAELIQAINKCLRYPDNAECKSNLIEEIVDVLIVIEQLKCIFNISNVDMDFWIDKKVRRIFERMESEKQ